MIVVDIIVSGLILGGLYATVALGLTLQYGVARIMNLAYGEFIVAAALLQRQSERDRRVEAAEDQPGDDDV
ncbi:MAG: hypothetical protein RLT05_15515, partial [Bauldia litoralis]